MGMAAKKHGGGKVLDLTTRVLIEIRDDVRKTNARLDALTTVVHQTNTRLDALTGEVHQVNARLDQTNARLDQTNARLENLRDIAGDRYRELDARIRVLEERLPH